MKLGWELLWCWGSGCMVGLVRGVLRGWRWVLGRRCVEGRRLWAGAATLGLATVAWGGIAWSELHWEATRQATVDAFAVIALLPGTFSLMEPLVRLLSGAAPVLLALQTLAGLALAWFWHARLDLAPAPVAALADGKTVLPSHT